MTTSPFRINRIVWLLLGLVVIAWLLYLIRGALLPFVLGGALAYIFDPAVSWIERRMPGMSGRPELKRLVSIFIMFAVAGGVAGAVLIAVIPPMIAEFGQFLDILPQLIRESRVTVEGWNDQISKNIPEEMRALVDRVVENAGTSLIDAGQGFVVRTLGVVSRTLTVILGLAAVPLFLFYVLKDREKILEGMVNTLSPEPRRHARNVATILNGVFSSYVRAQLFLGLVVGLMVFVGLWLLGVRFAPILGLVAGIFELVPIIGPWIGAIPGIVVVLATAPDKVIWVALLYLGVQLIENSLLVPRIQSQALNLHPVMIITVLIVGSEVAGLWGIILGPPLAAAAREVFLYFLVLRLSDRGSEPPPDAAGQTDAAPADDAAASPPDERVAPEPRSE